VLSEVFIGSWEASVPDFHLMVGLDARL
jgi:hypothetical protein